MTAKTQYTTSCDKKSRKEKPSQSKPPMRVILDPLPEPPDMAQRLAKIYALALLRQSQWEYEQAVQEAGAA